MVNTLKIKTIRTGAEPAATAFAEAELGVKQVAANYNTASSAKLYYGEDVAGDGTTVARAFGFGIYSNTGPGQGGVNIGGNMTFASNTGLQNTVSGSTVTYNLALNQLGHRTSDGYGDKFLVQDTADDEYYNLTKGSINLSGFNDDLTRSWYILDGDGTSVTMGKGKYIKFIEGQDIDIDFTDVSNGTSGDPYDITIKHKDTSSQASVDNSGNTFIQDIALDGRGHVTSLTSVGVGSLDNYSSWTLAGDGGSSQTISSGNTASILGTAPISTTASATDTVRVSLDNTAVTAASYTAASLTVDAQGRLTAASSNTLDNYSSWTLAGGSGSSQTISSGNTATITASGPMRTVASATDTLTISIADNTISNTQLEYDTGQNLTTSSDPTFANLELSSSDDDEPLLTLTGSDTSDEGPRIHFIRTGTSANNDFIGTHNYYHKNAAGSSRVFVRTDAQVIDRTTNGETGKYRIRVTADGQTSRYAFTATGDSSDSDVVDVEIADSTKSTTAIAGKVTLGAVAASTDATWGMLMTDTAGSGEIKYRTPAQVKSDIGASGETNQNAWSIITVPSGTTSQASSSVTDTITFTAAGGMTITGGTDTIEFSSANTNTDTLWTGTSSTLVAATGRTSLELGTSAVLDTAAIADAGTGVATADQIHTFVTSFGYLTADVSVADGGTGSSTASGARSNLGLGTAATTAATAYATSAQGTTADNALPKAGGAMTGAITTNSTFDGIDIATRDAVLTSTTTTAGNALPKAGGAMTGAITTNSTFDGVDVAAASVLASAALPKGGGAMTGAITTNSTFDGVDVAAASVLASAALPKGGGTMSGAIAMGSNNITGGGTAAFTTLNTGQGANNLYDMNQNVKSDSAVTFATLEITGTAGSIDTEGSIYLTGDEKVIRWYEGVNYISFGAPPTVSANTDYLWPAADGTGGYQLTTDGSGNLSWAASGGTATDFTVSANNSADETVYPIFVDGATGNQGAESDTGLTYNPNSGILTTTSVTGNLTGTVLTATQGTISHDSLSGFVSAEHVDWAGSSAGTIHATNYTNTTYSVGDGGLTQINFTTGDNTKLDAIEALADVTDATNVNAAGATMNSDLTSTTHVYALNQSVVSGATPTFTTTNFTDASNKRLMTDAQETILDNTSGTNTGDNTVCTSGAATTATQLYINSDETGDTSCYVLFTQDSTAGNKAVYEDSGLIYDNTNNKLTTTTFVGALTGNASGSSGSCTGNAATATALASSGTLTFTGDVSGGTTPTYTGGGNLSIAMSIASNSIDGTHIALGSDAQGDVMYYDGSNYVRLGYGTSGHFLKTQGSSANPVWAAAPNNNNYLTGLALSSGTLTATVTGAASPTVDLSGLYTAGTGLSRSSQTLSVDASQTQITSVGALNAGSITSGFGTINNGSSTITTTGALGCGAITSTGSFLVTTTDPKQMIFKYDTSNYMDIAVSSAGATTFRTVGAGSEVSHFTLNIDGDIILDAADDIHFQHDGADQLIWDMSSVGGEQKCRVGVNNDDILFAAYNGDEVIRVDTSAKRLTFFNSSGDEAIYGDGAALYLLSNGFPMKLPTAAPGGAGYSLTAATDGTCSWSNISGGGGGSSDITISGTPANNQIAIWTDANTQEGDSDLTFDGSEFLLNTTSTAGNHEVMEVRYTGTATGFGPVLKIFKMKDAADGDLGGRLEFAYKNDGGIQEGGATATLVIEESLNGDENTYLRFAAQIGGATRDIIDIGCPSTGEEYRALSPSSDNLCNLGFTSNAWINTYSREYAHYTGSQWLNGAGDGSELFLWTGEVQANPGSWQLQIASTTGGLTSFGYQPLPPSQLKYKENITDFTLGVDFLESLSPIHFDLKDSVEEALDMQPLKNQLGFTVEAFEAVPALVGYVQTHSVEDDKTVGYIPPKEEFKTIDYIKLHKDMNYALINAVKELSIKNDALEARLAILEAA